MKEDLITVGMLKSMLNGYADDQYVSFGDRYLVKLDDRDTDVVNFEWITYEEQEGLHQ